MKIIRFVFLRKLSPRPFLRFHVAENQSPTSKRGSGTTFLMQIKIMAFTAEDRGLCSKERHKKEEKKNQTQL